VTEGDVHWSAVETGRFRRDLFQRLAGVVIELPPLTARPEDVLPLASHFASLQGRRLEPGVERVLLNYT
jgi:DNA-binding NtrC family response regulator